MFNIIKLYVPLKVVKKILEYKYSIPSLKTSFPRDLGSIGKWNLFHSHSLCFCDTDKTYFTRRNSVAAIILHFKVANFYEDIIIL